MNICVVYIRYKHIFVNRYIYIYIYIRSISYHDSWLWVNQNKKHPITPNCVFCLSFSLLTWWFLKKMVTPLTQFSQFTQFLIFSFKKRRGLVRATCIHLKIYVIIFVSFRVFLLEHFDVFLMFYYFPCLIWFFKDFSTFL